MFFSILFRFFLLIYLVMLGDKVDIMDIQNCFTSSYEISSSYRHMLLYFIPELRIFLIWYNSDFILSLIIINGETRGAFIFGYWDSLRVKMNGLFKRGSRSKPNPMMSFGIRMNIVFSVLFAGILKFRAHYLNNIS